MRLVELKQGDRLVNIIYSDTIYAVAKRIGVDPTTVSKWRKIIDEAFWKEFSKALAEKDE